MVEDAVAARDGAERLAAGRARRARHGGDAVGSRSVGRRAEGRRAHRGRRRRRRARRGGAAGAQPVGRRGLRGRGARRREARGRGRARHPRSVPRHGRRARRARRPRSAPAARSATATRATPGARTRLRGAPCRPAFAGADGVPLDVFVFPRKESCTWVATKLTVASPQKLVVRLAATGQARLVFDGVDVGARRRRARVGAVRSARRPRSRRSPGAHLLAAKVCAGALDDDGRVRLRVTDASGAWPAGGDGERGPRRRDADLPAGSDRRRASPSTRIATPLERAARAARPPTSTRRPQVGRPSHARGRGRSAEPARARAPRCARRRVDRRRPPRHGGMDRAERRQPERVAEPRAREAAAGDARTRAFIERRLVERHVEAGLADWAMLALRGAKIDAAGDAEAALLASQVDVALGTDALRLRAIARLEPVATKSASAPTAVLETLADLRGALQSGPGAPSCARSSATRGELGSARVARDADAGARRGDPGGAARVRRRRGRLRRGGRPWRRPWPHRARTTRPAGSTSSSPGGRRTGPRCGRGSPRRPPPDPWRRLRDEAIGSRAASRSRARPRRGALPRGARAADAYARRDRRAARRREVPDLVADDPRPAARRGAASGARRPCRGASDPVAKSSPPAATRRRPRRPTSPIASCTGCAPSIMHPDRRVSELVHYAREIVIPPRTDDELYEDVPAEGDLTEIVRARVHRKDGSTAFPLEEANDDARPRIRWPELNAGDVVEVAFRSWTAGPVGGRGDPPFFRLDYAGGQSTHPVLYNEVVVESPRDRPIYVDVVNGKADRREEKDAAADARRAPRLGQARQRAGRAARAAPQRDRPDARALDVQGLERLPVLVRRGRPRLHRARRAGARARREAHGRARRRATRSCRPSSTSWPTTSATSTT